MWFPIIGWIIGFQLQCSRTYRACDEVVAQLKERRAFPTDAWDAIGGCPIRAEQVAKIVMRAAEWLPNHYFLPNDPMLLLTLEEEGLGFFDCIHEINQAMGIRIEVSDFQINDPFRKLVEVVALTSE